MVYSRLAGWGGLGAGGTFSREAWLAPLEAFHQQEATARDTCGFGTLEFNRARAALLRRAEIAQAQYVLDSAEPPLPVLESSPAPSGFTEAVRLHFLYNDARAAIWTLYNDSEAGSQCGVSWALAPAGSPVQGSVGQAYLVKADSYVYNELLRVAPPAEPDDTYEANVQAQQEAYEQAIQEATPPKTGFVEATVYTPEGPVVTSDPDEMARLLQEEEDRRAAEAAQQRTDEGAGGGEPAVELDASAPPSSWLTWALGGIGAFLLFRRSR